MTERKFIDPFARYRVAKSQASIGGSQPNVQRASEALLNNPNIPSLIASIYAPPALKNTQETDGRYNNGKADIVENIYLPSAARKE